MACGRRRYKAGAPWRFGHDDLDGSDAKPASGADGTWEGDADEAVSETNGETTLLPNTTTPGLVSQCNGAPTTKEEISSARDGGSHGFDGTSDSEGLDAAANGEATLLSNTTTPGLAGQYNGAPAKREESSSARDGGSQGFGTAAGCRRGRKVLVPWRFQRGFKRSQCTAASHGPTKIKHGSRGPSRVTVSATKYPSMLRGAASKPKKKNKMAISREGVMASLREFRVIYPDLLEEEEKKCSKQEERNQLAAFQVYREKFCPAEYDERRRVGSVPGVQVGDVFDSSFELSLVGLHRSQHSCVDYVKRGRTFLAVSVVSALNNNLDFLMHVGSTTAGEKMEDTDKALMRSMDTETYVRVIYRSVVQQSGGKSPSKELTYFVYGGLYLVEKFWREAPREDRFITTFHLRRLPGQPHIDIQELVKNRMAEPFHGTFIQDMSAGLEKIPISAINTISNEYLASFRYISHIKYPLKDQPTGCDCVGQCSDSPKCACAVKNGGEIPFRKNGRIFGEKPLVYECGPSCRCPPTCHNRVGQHGIKFRLQVFKTESMGWGVRSLDFIREGSFVCEYIGELLEHEEAEKRENDEYLFSIGHNYYNVPRWDNLRKTMPSLRNGPEEAEVNAFALDALKCGNFARFINHSCTPNLFSQSLLYDHDNKRMPHVGLFADVDILPLQPLSYDYNYVIDGVHDSEGNIKKKQCLCGSADGCTRLGCTVLMKHSYIGNTFSLLSLCFLCDFIYFISCTQISRIF